MKAPFPWFGGKSRAAEIIWSRFGNPHHYIEPFAGSLAVLLKRPGTGPWKETVNDLDGLLVNFWRALKADCAGVAEAADWPVSEIDLTARHMALVNERERVTARLLADPDWCDVKLAGWWLWGVCSWIGSGWCSGNGPWQLVGGEFVKGNAATGINRQMPHLGNAGRGINRKLPHLVDAGQGINRKLPHLVDAGQGINRKLPSMGHSGQGRGIHAQIGNTRQMLAPLAERVRALRICSGEWERVVKGPIRQYEITGVLLDPPYSADDAVNDVYATEHSNEIAKSVREWAIANGHKPHLRIALCGFEGEHDLPPDWECVAWSAAGGYAGGKNADRERIWFSPHCLKPTPTLFDL